MCAWLYSAVLGSCFAALVEYKEISGKTLQESVEGEMSGPLEELLVAIGIFHVP